MSHALLCAVLLVTSGCVHLARGGDAARRQTILREARISLARQEFARSERDLRRLAREQPGTEEGRTALFYLGALRLDPRNPSWDPRIAEADLAGYLSAQQDSVPSAGEYGAHVLESLAEQLLASASRRAPPLRNLLTDPSEDSDFARDLPPPQTPACECVTVDSVAALQQQISEKDAEIARQNEELERIRRTLTPRPPR